MKPHVMIIDDDLAIRMSLSSVLATYGFMTSCFDEIGKALDAIKTTNPDCVVLDVRMPDMDGLIAQMIISEATLAPPVIMITGHGDVAMAVRAMKNGAFDFVEKPIDDERLVTSIQAGIQQRHQSPHTGPDIKALGERYDQLTERERTVAAMVIDGYSSAAIAATLAISIRTVDHHRAKIMAKMGATSLSQLLRYLLAIS